MNKKLMPLAAGVLAAVVLAAFPVIASAGEFTADCETGATCQGTIAGGAAAFSNTAGETISCTSVTGTASLTSGTSTGTVSLSAQGCKETVTIFQFSCNSAGQAAGVITTGTLVGHGVYIDPEKELPGILITNVNITFECAGFAKKTVTGNLLGADPTPECGVFKSTETESLGSTAHGQQQYKQVTTTGTVFDLISSNHSGGAYLTSALTGTATITASAGNKVKATC